MNALVIGDKQYELPAEFGLKQWSDYQLEKNPVKQLSISMKIPLTEAELVPAETRDLVLAIVNQLAHPKYLALFKEIGDHKLLSVNNLTLGQFIDMEVYLSDNPAKHLMDIVKLLYQTDDLKGFTFNNTWAAVEYYLKWRTTLFSQYKNLFNADGDLDEDDEVNASKSQNIAHIWYDIVMTLADNKFLNIDAVVERPVVECFNWLAWNKDNKRREAEQLRQIA